MTRALDGAVARSHTGLEDRDSPRGPGFDSYTIRRFMQRSTSAMSAMEGDAAKRHACFEHRTGPARDRVRVLHLPRSLAVIRDVTMEGEVTRVVAPASNTGEGPRGSGFESPASRSRARAREIRHRDVAQEWSACSGNTRPQVRFLLLPYEEMVLIWTVRNPDSVSFMPSLRGTRHDSANIEWRRSESSGGTSAGRRARFPISVDTLDSARDTTLCFTSRLHVYGPLVLGYRR